MEPCKFAMREGDTMTVKVSKTSGGETPVFDVDIKRAKHRSHEENIAAITVGPSKPSFRILLSDDDCNADGRLVVSARGQTFKADT